MPSCSETQSSSRKGYREHESRTERRRRREARSGELFRFLWARKLWWLVPFVSVLLLVAVLLLVGEATGVAPFIYTLF